jgi:hypothetical protein
LRELLERVDVPGAEAARERARAVVLASFTQREPVSEVRRRRPFVLVLALVGAAVVLAAASPPGRAVIDRVREVVGVERAQTALFSLPAPGRLLVVSDGGLWVVQPDGSRRRLGAYRAASWSPFGRFVVATRANELAALEPDGDVRWTLARPAATDAAWAGTRSDTRIAYADRSGIRLVAGDGTGDRLLIPAASGPVAWRPGGSGQLAFVSAGGVRVVDVDTGRVVWRVRARPAGPVRALEWSSDGRRLLVLHPTSLRVYDDRGRVTARDDPSDATQDADAAFRPGTHEVAVIRVHGAQSTVFRLATGNPLFNGTGTFDQVAWSPDGRRLLVTWPTADQWVFVPAPGPRRVEAVANVSAQFRSTAFPRVEGWCCER